MQQNSVLVWLCFCLSLVACTYPSHPIDSENLPEEPVDSLSFVNQHHYAVNYNFSVLADSMLLAVAPMDSDSVVVYKNDLIVVADMQIVPSDSLDSVYIKVARDQETIGWIHESRMLQNVEPDDPISSFINTFSGNHMPWFVALIGLAVLLYLFRFSRKKASNFVHFNDIDSPYPTILCVLVAISAAFYGSIQHFVPETWIHYYYHPTLNPFELPFAMSCFLVCVWSILLVGLAVVDEVRHQLRLEDAFVYLVGLGSTCVLCYIFFTLTIPYYVGYAFLVAYIIFALKHCDSFFSYHCGACGKPIPQKKGRCPHCGALNQ